MAQVHGELVSQPPQDGITRIRFNRESNYLLASSWDCTTRLYDASGKALTVYPHSSPVMDCCFQSQTVCFSSCLDGNIVRTDTATGHQQVIGSHQDCVKCVEWAPELGLLVTAGWDNFLRYWDLRTSTCVVTSVLPGKAYTLSTSASHVVVGTAGRHVWIYHGSRLHEPEQRRESSLKYQTRCITCYPNDTGYALASVEGRVAMEYFNPAPEAQAAKYAFKCHRRAEGGVDVVYPVNAMAFHEPYGTFATGGSDGVVNIWDGNNKKRLFQIAGYPTAVSSLAFTSDGSTMAVASSYMFEQGEQEHPRDAIYLRKMQDVEVRPKPRQQR